MEFKLNPGAKVFCPSFANHRSVTPPAVPTVANVAYVPDFPVVPVQQEAEISQFVPRSSLPVKLVPYGNLIAGNGVIDSQYSQSVCLCNFCFCSYSLHVGIIFNYDTGSGSGFS